MTSDDDHNDKLQDGPAARSDDDSDATRARRANREQTLEIESAKECVIGCMRCAA